MKQQFIGLQALRFVAAMLVVAMHVTQAISMRITGKGAAEYWGAGGVGVDIFFVISGFVMAVTTAGLAAGGDRLAAASVFVKRRLLRIVPLYWFYTLLKVALLLLVPAVAVKSTFDTGHVVASFLFVPSVNSDSLTQPLLQVGWTLNFEMMFYLVFAISIALSAPRILFCLAAFGALFLASYLLPQSVPLAFYANLIIFEFVAGIAIATALKRYAAPSPWVGLLSMLAGTLFVFAVPWISHAGRLMPGGVAAAAIVTGAVWAEPLIARARAARQLAFLGDASYSIYLSHPFVVPAGVVLCQRLGVTDPVAVFVLASALTVLVGCLSHVWLEKPLISLLHRFFFRKALARQAAAAGSPAN